MRHPRVQLGGENRADSIQHDWPIGLEDVSHYPHLFRVLLERGYGEADLEKLASGNVFRVWQQVEAAARP
jgi:membrane dipeptidase